MRYVITILKPPSSPSHSSLLVGSLQWCGFFLSVSAVPAAPPERLTTLNEAPWSLCAFGDRVFFTADDGEHGQELWVSDGTLGGTRLFRDLRPGPEGAVYGIDLLAPVGGRFFFRAVDGDHAAGQLWVSDGTPDGTQPARTSSGEQVDLPTLNWFFVPGMGYAASGDRIFVLAGQSASYFWAGEGDVEGSELPVRGFLDLKGWLHGRCAALGERLLYSSHWGLETMELWVADESGQELLTESPDFWSLLDLRAVGDRVYFFHGSGGLWVTDGTPEGTTPFRELLGQPEGWGARFPVQVGQRLFFPARDDEHGLELWTSDGTPDGTRLVLDIQPGGTSARFSKPFHAVGERLLFTITPEEGDGDTEELWVSDGTSEGTRPFRELLGQPETWRANADITPVEVDGLLFFVADDGEHGEELWVSDGTREGTRIVAETVPGPESSFPLDMFPTPSITPAGDRLFFTAIAPGLGPQLWVLDLRDLDHRFRRADCNSDGALDISDAITTLGSLFLGEGQPSCADACDANDDGEWDVSDAVFTLGVLFLGGENIPLPGSLDCGVDPTGDGSGCAQYSACP